MLFGRRDARDGAATDSDGRARHFFSHSLRFLGIVHPRFVKFKRTFRLTFDSVTVRTDTSVPTVHEFEQLILRLIIGASIANTRNGNLPVLNTIVLRSTVFRR